MTTCSNCGYQTSIEIPPIPVPNLLGTSRILSPSESEAGLIQDTIHRLHDELWRLNNEVIRVQTLLHNLTRNRDALSTYYHSQKALLAPIRRIPPEILSEIFLSSIPFHLESGAAFPKRKDVLLPGRICRHWRDVAISTPRLWSALKFDLRVQYIDMEIEMAWTWLARSGSVALTLGLDSYEEKPETHPLTDVVLALAPRIHCLTFRATLSILQSLRNVKNRIPNLHTLIIDWLFFDSSELLPSLDTFKIAPKLYHLELRTMVSVQIPDVPWAQLLELHLIDPQFTVNDCLQALRDSPYLVSFHMYADDSQQLDDTIIPHSTLRELDADLRDFIHLFNSLSLPALTSLSCRTSTSWPRDEFLSFLHRSSFSLQKLVLEADDYLEDDYADNVLECLRHTPNLLELELLSCSGNDNSFWNGLSVNHHDSLRCLVPKLQRIQVTRSFDFDYTTFVDMVQSRWRLNSVPSTVHNIAMERIQCVEVSLIADHEHYNMYDDCVDRGGEYFGRLRQFRAEGLEVIAPDMDTMWQSASSFDEDSGQDDSIH